MGNANCRILKKRTIAQQETERNGNSNESKDQQGVPLDTDETVLKICIPADDLLEKDEEEHDSNVTLVRGQRKEAHYVQTSQFPYTKPKLISPRKPPADVKCDYADGCSDNEGTVEEIGPLRRGSTTSTPFPTRKHTENDGGSRRRSSIGTAIELMPSRHGSPLRVSADRHRDAGAVRPNVYPTTSLSRPEIRRQENVSRCYSDCIAVQHNGRVWPSHLQPAGKRPPSPFPNRIKQIDSFILEKMPSESMDQTFGSTTAAVKKSVAKLGVIEDDEQNRRDAYTFNQPLKV